jgi:hypothetical protein
MYAWVEAQKTARLHPQDTLREKNTLQSERSTMISRFWKQAVSSALGTSIVGCSEHNRVVSAQHDH